ncbi:MAG: hypothetical protein V4481_04980 [Patescibacteria group bacterium]
MKRKTFAIFQFSINDQLVFVPEVLSLHHLVEMAQERCKGRHFCQVTITLAVGIVALGPGKVYDPPSNWKRRYAAPLWNKDNSTTMCLEQFLQTIRELFSGVSFQDLFLIIYDEFYRVVNRDELNATCAV